MSSSYKESLTFFGKNAFDWMDFLTSSISMPIAAIITCIFLGFFVDKEKIKNKFTQHVPVAEHRSMYSYVRLSIDRCTATYV